MHCSYFMKMNLNKICTLAVVLVGISAANEVFYVLPDSPNISCPSHQCATFSQYFLDNDTLPVISNVEYHLLPEEHHVISTEMIILAYLQNFSLVGLYNKQLELPSTILVSTNITILNSYNFTATNIIFKPLTLFQFSEDTNYKIQLAVCICCTVENVTLLSYGLLGYNLIGRSNLNNIVIDFATPLLHTKYWCNHFYDYQGIMLHYGNYSFNESKSEIAHGKCIITVQNISVYYDRICFTNKEIIHVDIEEYQIVNSIEIIISNSQFNDLMLQPIMIIKDNSDTIRCMIWIINCTFQSILIRHTPIITVAVSQFNTALNFFNCEFHYCSGSKEYLVLITVTLNFRNVPCTNITFNKCNFSNNNGGLLSFRNVWLPYCNCNLNILFIGPTYISGNEISSASANILKLIHIYGMVIRFYGPINISNNTVHNDIMVFHSCKVFINGPITISSNVAFEKNVMLLESCSVLFQGPITISHHFDTDSIILFFLLVTSHLINR